MSDHPHADADLNPSRPTHVRYAIVGAATIMAVLLYLHRFFLGYLIPLLTEEYALTDQAKGFLLSGFFLTYAMAQVPSGWMTDRFGARLMLAIYIALWSLFTGLVGVAIGFVSILVLRLCCGAAQAGAYPTSASIISKWIPFSARGSASSIIAVGGRLGGSAAPILTALVLVMFVPLSVSSFLTEEDMLSPTKKFLKVLTKTGDTPQAKVAETLRRMMPSAYMQNRAALEKLDAGEATKLLNEILKRPDLYDKVELKQFKLPREAWRLSEIPADELTEEQIVRRNRLLLEAVFPDSIRKIYIHGWRPVALIYGLVGLVVAVLFWLVVRNRPEDHPGCNEAERQYIEAGRPATSSPHGRVGAIPIHYIVRSRSLWLSSVSQFCTNVGWVFLGLMLPDYLVEVHNIPPIQLGIMASLPMFIGMAGMLGGGWLTDRLTRALGVRWGRGLPMSLTRFTAMAAYLACLVLQSPWLLVAAFCLVAVSTDLGTAAVWAFKQDVGGRYVGSVLGWGNMWGNFGAFLAPNILYAFYGEYRWELRFLACACAFAIAGIAALGIDARIPIAPPDED